MIEEPATRLKAGFIVDEVAAAEAVGFEEMLEQRRRGEVSEDDFRHLRVLRGIYGMRGQADIQMVRVKVPYGALDAPQLDCLGWIAANFADGIGHITTRQDIQFHWVALARVPQLLRALAEVGLTTRESGGNIVRNVTACPLAGVCATEVFDVTPYAAALSRRLLRHPAFQALPRKFKIAFSGCAQDCALAAIHDLGAFAAWQAGQRGFRVYVGGGLGSAPQAAQLLELFTPVANLLPTTLAILRVFDRLGNRQNKARARLKFLVKDLGIEEFRRLVFEERAQVAAENLPDLSEESERAPAANALSLATPSPQEGFADWRTTNVVAQKQAGWYAAYVKVPAGNLTANQFRGLAALLRQFPTVELRTTSNQNLALRWVREEWLAALHAELIEMGLGQAGAQGIANVTSCPGASTCNLAVTYSQRLALELSRQLAAHPDAIAEDLRDVTIKIGGCPNSCGHHQIATIGFYGAARQSEGRQIPCYQLLLGGAVGDGPASFGKPILRIPARRVPEVIFRLVVQYRTERSEGESFRDWVRRKQNDGLAQTMQTLLADLIQIPSYEQAPELYSDWGEEGAFKVQVGKGECAQ